MKLNQLLILLAILVLTQSFFRNLQTDIPCVNTLVHQDNFTTANSSASGVALSSWTSATTVINNQQYKYFYGNWSAAVNDNIVLDTTGYSTTGDNVFILLVRATRNSTFTTNATGAKVVAFSTY